MVASVEMVGLAREIFGGDLRDVSLNSLLQLARAEAVSGWIRVDPRGEVSLAAGRVVGARCGPLTGVDALRELLLHDEGHFVPAPRVAMPPLRASAPARAPGPSHTPPLTVSAQPTAAQSIDGADFFERIDRGRAQMRASDFDAAERSLRRALELRPGDRVALQNLRALAQCRGDNLPPKK